MSVARGIFFKESLYFLTPWQEGGILWCHIFHICGTGQISNSKCTIESSKLYALLAAFNYDFVLWVSR